MNVTEPIIHAALLGTANRELPLNGFPEILEKTFRHIQQEAEDAETALYRMSALAFAYHRAGSEPLHTEGGTCIAEAPEEVLPYFNSEVGELLAYLNQQRNRYLLLYAYRKAAGHNRLIPPSYLCPLIRQAYERNNPNKEEEQTLLSELTGRRGRWLLGHMQLPDWGGDGEEPWETAPHAERKRMLCNLRKTDARQGLALLQTKLKNETAAHRNELIQCLSINLSKDDEPFLQEIMRSDRSGTVKETARQLLSRLPDSALVETYCEWLRGHLHQRVLLGWSYDPLPFTPEMKQMGLEEVSPNKKEKNEAYLLRQLAERVPLRFWMEFFQCPAEQAVTGALNRSSRRRNPRYNEIDWKITITKNLKNYQPEYKTIIPEIRIGYGRKRKALKDIILCLDQSGSMGTSVIYSGIFGAVLASLPAVNTRMVVFDTAVVDLTDDLQDPVDLLFGVQLGGGTDIARALTYCQEIISRPQDTVLVLVTDLYEGGEVRDMYKRFVELVNSGVQLIVLPALNDDGAPAYDKTHAAFLAELGVPTFACTPDKFPDLMAAALSKQDIGMWVSQNISR